jgi:uncharacterized damage-inducible protein DinB
MTPEGGPLMSVRIPWVLRRFNFDFEANLYPELIERLRSAPVRLDDRVRGLPDSLRTLRHREGKWSIQEHAGHLGDLESLWAGRVEAFLSGAAELGAADMTNRKTTEADHNAIGIDEVLAAFHRERAELVAKLDSLDPSDFSRVSMHPRLVQRMRLVDTLLILAEHDDYHMATITDLLGVEGG